MGENEPSRTSPGSRDTAECDHCDEAGRPLLGEALRSWPNTLRLVVVVTFVAVGSTAFLVAAGPAGPGLLAALVVTTSRLTNQRSTDRDPTSATSAPEVDVGE